MAKITIQDKWTTVGQSTGFDYLRVGLALAVVTWHSLWIGSGLSPWNTWYRFVPAAIIPLFFALSGFLVAGSLERNTLRGFLTLRFIRIFPALTIEVTLSAVAIGLYFTSLPALDYLTNRHFLAYFLNIIGLIHYQLPGVFEDQAVSHRTLNAQLWTIPFEFKCYLYLAILSILQITKSRFLFTFATVALVIASTVRILHTGVPASYSHVPGRVLTMSFLAAVAIYQYRHVIPYSTPLAIVSGILGALCLEYQVLNYLAVFPIAYLTVWLGMKTPPAIPFGDLSYGIYLFHYPIEQTIKHLFPQIQSWWQLELVSLPIIAGFAFLSWTFVEHPILLRKKLVLQAVDRFFSALTRRNESKAETMGPDGAATEHV